MNVSDLSLAIRAMYEFEGGSGPVTHWYCDGHIDTVQFAEAVSYGYDEIVDSSKVQHTYRHFIPATGGERGGWWALSDKGGRSGWAKTTIYDIGGSGGE